MQTLERFDGKQHELKRSRRWMLASVICLVCPLFEIRQPPVLSVLVIPMYPPPVVVELLKRVERFVALRVLAAVLEGSCSITLPPRSAVLALLQATRSLAQASRARIFSIYRAQPSNEACIFLRVSWPGFLVNSPFGFHSSSSMHRPVLSLKRQ
jgi:hypothetical protein